MIAASQSWTMKILLPCALLTALLFLLSADLLFVLVAGKKIKFGYILVPAAWLFAPRAMWHTVRSAVAKLPRYVWLPLLPLAPSSRSASPECRRQE